jgi:hypothetical protein
MVRSTATPCVSNHEATAADPIGKRPSELPRRPDRQRQRKPVPSCKIVTAGYPGRHRIDATTSSSKPGREAGVSGAPHSPLKCDPNRENRPTSTRQLTPGARVHVCIASG